MSSYRIALIGDQWRLLRDGKLYATCKTESEAKAVLLQCQNRDEDLKRLRAYPRLINALKVAKEWCDNDSVNKRIKALLSELGES